MTWLPRGNVPNVYDLMGAGWLPRAFAQEFPDGTGSWWVKRGEVANPAASLKAAQEAAEKHIK